MAVRLCYVAELCGRLPIVHCPRTRRFGTDPQPSSGVSRKRARRRDTREMAVRDGAAIEICGGYTVQVYVCAPGLCRLMYASGRRYETATCLHKQVRHGPPRIVSYGIVKVGYCG